MAAMSASVTAMARSNRSTLACINTHHVGFEKDWLQCVQVTSCMLFSTYFCCCG